MIPSELLFLCSDIEFRRKVDVQRHVLKELQNYDRMRVSSLFIKRNSVMKNKSEKEAKLREKDKQVQVILLLSSLYLPLVKNICHELGASLLMFCIFFLRTIC